MRAASSMGRAEPIVMMNRSVLKPRPDDRPRLDEIDLDRRCRWDFHGDAAEFAVALSAVAVTEKEIGPFRLHREIGDRAWGDIGQVHVAAPVVRLQRQHGFDLRADAERADEGLERQDDLVVA
jgi:hypothetical protein